MFRLSLAQLQRSRLRSICISIVVDPDRDNRECRLFLSARVGTATLIDRLPEQMSRPPQLGRRWCASVIVAKCGLPDSGRPTTYRERSVVGRVCVKTGGGGQVRKKRRVEDPR